MLPKQTEGLFDKDAALLIGGLATFWPCIKEPTFFLVGFLQKSNAGAMWGLLSLLLYLAAVLLASAALARLLRNHHDLLSKKGVIAFAGCCGAVGFAMASSEGFFNAIGVAMLIPDSIFIVVFVNAWGGMLVERSKSSIPLIVALSFALSELLKLSCALLDVSWGAVVFSLVSAVLLLLASRGGGATLSLGKFCTKAFPWQFLAPFVGFVALWSFVLGFSTEDTLGSLSWSGRIWLYGLGGASLLAMALFFGAMAKKGFSRHALLHPLVTVVVVYMALLALVIYPQTFDHGFVKVGMLVMQGCLNALAFILVSYTVAERRLPQVMLFALCATLFNGSFWMILGDMVKSMGYGSVSLANSHVALVLLFVTTSALIVFLLRYVTQLDKGLRRQKAQTTVEEALCNKLASAKGLTEREKDILSLLYRGYSGKAMSQELFISESTVRTHTDRVYRKLSVHSKQELIKMVDAYRD